MISTLRKLFKKDSFIYGVIISLSLITYGVILQNDFTVVDDLAAFVNNQTIRNVGSSIQTMQLQLILYTIYYHLFGLSPIPLHIQSLVLHITNTILFFLIFQKLFNRKTAIIASILAAVHPINTEAVTWISGSPYLFNALIFNISVWSYLKFKETTDKKYVITSAAVFIAGLITIQTIWLVMIPVVMFIIDQFIIEKKFNLKASQYLMWFIIPLVVFGTVYIGIKGTARLATRSIEKPMNQQSLRPILESAPYTVFTMTRLYFMPKDLMIYYDGNPINQIYYVSMYIVTLIYGIFIIYFWKKKRAAAGILIILVILLAPTYSPVKVAWYLSERYLYFGTGFFAVLLAMGIVWCSKKMHRPIFAVFIVSVLTMVYVGRAIVRNLEFKNTQSLARATIRTSPHSIRGYDDLGGDYLLKGNYKDALPLFRKTLSILPDSNTAISNLGYIYILYGIPQTSNDLTESMDAKELLRLGSEYYKQSRYTNAFYYLYQHSLLQPKNADSKIIMADIYIKTDQFLKAENMYLEVLKLRPGDVKVFNKLAFAAYRQNKFDRALMYLTEALKYEPSNQNVLDNIKLIQQTKLQGGIR